MPYLLSAFSVLAVVFMVAIHTSAKNDSYLEGLSDGLLYVIQECKSEGKVELSTPTKDITVICSIKGNI